MEFSRRLLFGNGKWGIVMRIILLFVILTFPFFYKYNVAHLSGSSMFPTHENKDVLLVERNRGQYVPERFDVICIQSNNEKWIKRIIGLPGDHIIFGTCIVYINGKRVNEYEYFEPNFEFPRITIVTVDLIIPPNHVWVIGDNRSDSAFGLFSEKDIVGKVVY
tara:strand:- start:742 stop:1230 length:489 start_codon:yes stop_codon:yes gene_type:complete